MSELRVVDVLPHSVEAEEAVLGGVLADGGQVYEVGDLAASDFFIERHAWVWSVIEALRDGRTAIDVVTVSAVLEQREELAAVGGAGALLGWMQAASPWHVGSYAGIVREHSLRRGLLNAASRMARLAHSDDVDAEGLLAAAERITYDATRSREMEGDPPTLRAHIDEHTRVIERGIREPDTIIGHETGLLDFDRLVGGLQPEWLVIAPASRPGMGKSAWLLQVLLHLARGGTPTALFSLEMGAQEVITRALAQYGKLTHSTLTGRQMGPHYGTYIELQQALSDVKGFHIDDRPRLGGVGGLYRRVQRMVREKGVQVVGVDYLQLIKEPGFTSKENRVAELSHISRELKLMARDLGIVVIAAAQLNRKVEERSNKRPLMSDLRESGSIEQDADMVVMLYRDSYYNEESLSGNQAELIVTKHRHGPTGTAFVGWQGEYVRFVNTTPVHVDLEQEVYGRGR